jgi:predicted ester cyclase
MTPEEHKTKVRQAWDEAWKGNVDALDEITAPDILDHQPPLPDTRGLAAYKQTITEMRKTFSDIQFRFDEIIVEGDSEVARWALQGTHTGQMQNMPPAPPTGKRVTITGIGFAHQKNGKTVEIWQYIDMLGLFQQLGMVPAMSKAA